MNHYAGMTRTSGKANLVCDLRSDTLTTPDEGMRAAMAAAEVGDDVYGEDPTVNRLEAEMASRLGKEAGIFVSSGTQSNLVAMMAHCGRGEEIIVGNGYHIYCDEAGGPAVLAGISPCPVATEADGGISPETVAGAIKDDDPHYAHSRLLCLENTTDGKAIPIEKMQAAAQVAREHGLSVHLDGARFFNAVTALGCDAKDLAEVFDTVSVCLSKGLGTPVGSVLVGDAATIAKARRHRKILGGGMRQVGVLAAAGLHALEHNIAGLAEDHVRAAHLADTLQDLDAGSVETGTNMVFFSPAPEHHAALRSHMAEAGVLIGGQSPAIRMVLHRDVDDTALDRAVSAFTSYYRNQ